MARCCVLVSDLMSWSRLRGPIRAAGLEPVQVRRTEDLAALTDVAAIVVDLTDPSGGPAAVARARAARPDALLVAIGPHMRTDLMEAARAAGADETMPNSAVAGRLAALLERPGRP